MDQVIDFVIWAALIQGLLLAIMFLTSKEHKSFSNKILGYFLIALIVEAILAFIPIDSIFGYSINGYFELPEPKIFLPLLFVHYILVKIGRSKEYHLFLKINYVIAFAVAGITIINILLFAATRQTIDKLFSFDTINIVFLMQQTYAVILCVGVLIISMVETNKYTVQVSDEYSNYELLSISWLWRFIFILLPATFLWGAELIRIYVGYYTGSFTSWNFVNATWGVLIIFIYFVSYQAFKHKDLFENLQQPTLKPTNEKEEDENMEAIQAPLIKCMQEDKLFLKDDLSIFEVAKQIGTSTRKVSTCINNYFKSNFSEWVNGYRVNEVKRRFEEEDSKYLTIEAIGQESGFKSRSAMYSAFKKLTGHSPAKFRKTELS